MKNIHRWIPNTRITWRKERRIEKVQRMTKHKGSNIWNSEKHMNRYVLKMKSRAVLNMLS